MPKTKKPASSSDSDSGPDDRAPVSKKPKEAEKPQKKSSGDDSGELEWHIDGMRYLKVREFRGRQQIDIREYYEKDGEIRPGKKGISLSPAQWKKVLGFADDVNKALH